MEQNSKFAQLIIKFLVDDLSATEYQDLQEIVASSDKKKRLFQKFNDPDWIAARITGIYQFDKELGWEKFKTLINRENRNPKL